MDAAAGWLQVRVPLAAAASCQAARQRQTFHVMTSSRPSHTRAAQKNGGLNSSTGAQNIQKILEFSCQAARAGQASCADRRTPRCPPAAVLWGRAGLAASRSALHPVRVSAGYSSRCFRSSADWRDQLRAATRRSHTHGDRFQIVMCVDDTSNQKNDFQCAIFNVHHSSTAGHRQPPVPLS
jgi:hypothetical protein